MTDAEFETTKARICAIFDRWRTPLGLDDWIIHRKYYDDTGHYAAALGPDAHPQFGIERSIACTRVSWEYKEAAIDFCVSNCVELAMDDDALEVAVIHEMCHILVNEMRYVSDCTCDQFNVKHEERVVVDLSWAFVRTRQQFAPRTPYEPPAADVALW